MQFSWLPTFMKVFILLLGFIKIFSTAEILLDNINHVNCIHLTMIMYCNHIMCVKNIFFKSVKFYLSYNLMR